MGRCLANPFTDIECRDWSAKTLYIEISEVFELCDRVDLVGHPGTNQYLAVLSLGTKAGGKVAHRADRGVAGAFGETVESWT